MTEPTEETLKHYTHDIIPTEIWDKYNLPRFAKFLMSLDLEHWL